MKRILAHNECDAQKRRDAFGERYNAYIGRGYDLDEIKKTIFTQSYYIRIVN